MPVKKPDRPTPKKKHPAFYLDHRTGLSRTARTSSGRARLWRPCQKQGTESSKGNAKGKAGQDSLAGGRLAAERFERLFPDQGSPRGGEMDICSWEPPAMYMYSGRRTLHTQNLYFRRAWIGFDSEDPGPARRPVAHQARHVRLRRPGLSCNRSHEGLFTASRAAS